MYTTKSYEIIRRDHIWEVEFINEHGIFNHYIFDTYEDARRFAEALGRIGYDDNIRR